MIQSIILLEGKNDALFIKNKKNLKESIIICFDYHSHKILENYNISHELIEEIIDEYDEEKIDLNVVRIITNWYKEDFCRENLEFNNLNLGFCIEPYLPILISSANKRIIGIKKVLEKFKPKKIICGTLINYVNEFDNKNIEIIFEPTPYNSNTDKMNIPIDIFGKSLKFKLTQKQFLKIKNYVEKITSILFYPKFKNKTNSNKNNILLLDFNIIQYFEMIKKLENEFDNVILLNQRKPVIWNLKSLKKFKKTNSKIVNFKKFEKSIENENNIDEKILHEKIIQMFNNEKFKEYFSYEGQSFWNSIKNDFQKFVLEKASDLVWRYNISKTILKEINVNCILEWAHIAFDEKIIVNIANEEKIPVIFIQHALNQHNKKFEKYRPFIPVLPSQNSIEAIWGEHMFKILRANKMEKNSVIVGSPKHDKYFKTKDAQNKNKNKNVLIAISDFFEFTMAGKDTRDYIKFEKSIEVVINYFKKYTDLKPIIKVHPNPTTYFDIVEKIKRIDPKITIFKNKDTFELIKNCDSLISINFSTILLEGMILDKPTMCLSFQRQNFIEEPNVKMNSTIFIEELSDIEKSLNELIFNQKIRKTLVSNGKKFVDEYLSNQGNASEALVKILKEYNK
jgi:hypothetical protein